MKTLLVFGGNSLIAKDIIQKIQGKYKLNIITTSSKNNNDLLYFDFNNEDSYKNLLTLDNVDYVLWSQGYNVNDSIMTLNKDDYLKSMDVNINYIVLSLNYLIRNNKINTNARLCIISSIWQEYVRNNKLSYSVSKSAISGLVKSVACDLAEKNILINAILPGPILNEMTLKTLCTEQIENIKTKLGYDRLIDTNDIYNLFEYLCFKNNSTTGQSIKVDLGFTNLCNY
jgi:3-oxoacyl-[acyl-carrier protein] reductase